MHCAGCGQENREGRKFCSGCGARLVLSCPACGTANEPGERFCGECGLALVAGAQQRTPSPTSPPHAESARSETAGARTVVSIIFADLVGSTALHERLDAESVRQFMERYYAAMRGAVEAHGGRVTQVMGDGVKAVFGAPRVAEDDAIRAVRAGVAMQEAFRALADEQRGRVGKTGLRVAVNTGEVVSDGESEIIGDPVNVAARLQEQGKDGDVVIGGATQRIVGSLVTLDRLGSFALKGRSEQVEAYRVVSLEPPAATKAAFVGRDEELARLSRVYETAVAKPAAQLAVLLGSPGLGKSRLIDEFTARLGDSATLLLAHCDAAGGPTFAPLVAALRERLGLGENASAEAVQTALEAVVTAGDADRARVVAGVAALLVGSPASPEETFFVIRRLLAALAQQRPVVLVIDDLHWAESLLLDLVEHLVQWGSGVPLFVLVGARPELRELRSSLVVPGGFVGEVLTLAGLDAGAAMRLAAGVIGAADLPAALAAKLLAASEGNPLFVGELIKMLVQEGVLQKDGERWVASAALADLEMPPTIHALLAARIERLRPEERAVLERAAVVGRHFSKSAVAALLSQTSDLDARLEALRRSELIERDTGWYLGEPVLRFHHVLIRDAAYRRILKGTRAELHARLAGWIEAKVGEAAEHDEVIGWHLEQAHQHLAELGPLDASGVALGERAAQRLAAAGRRALAGDDVPLAASLLGRAIERLDPEEPARADLALDWCEALLAGGEVGPAAAAIAELGRFTASSDRLRAWHTCFASELTVQTAPQGLQNAADAVAEAAQQLTALGDAAGEAKAHAVHAQALARLGKVGACEAALDQALAAARRAGDRRRANAVLAGAPLAALWGPSPVTRASGRCLDVVRVLRITQGAPAVESVALSCQGVLEALRGRTDAARRMLASARKMVEELGIASRLFQADVFAGRIEAMEGDPVAAERLLRGAYDGLRNLGLGVDAAQAGALLARTLLAQDRVAEAEALSHESEALAGDDLQAAIAWRGVRAEALAQRGEHAAAIELAQAAVGIASATDALLDHARARMALAAALRAAGRGAEADAEERRALELWAAKGATLLVERTRTDRGRVEPAAVTAEEPTAAPPAARRRVRPNAAIAAMDRSERLRAAHDWAAYEARFHEDYVQIDHPTEAAYGRDAAIASLQRLLQEREPSFAQEPLATLGEFLVLSRRRTGAAGTASGGRFDVGVYENEVFALNEVDDSGLHRSSEVFAATRLGDAIARLYERHAELLPEGPERDRATATAHVVATLVLAPNDLDRVAAVLAPDLEGIDHRSLSTWSLRGAEAYLAHLRALHEVADDVAFSVREILALEPDALLTRVMHWGTERLGGGAYERLFLSLHTMDADGRFTRFEWFDSDHEAEALARFDALTRTPARAPVRRPVRANAATRSVERLAAAIDARDADALEPLFDESLHVVHHPTRATFGRRGLLTSMRSMLRAAHLDHRDEVLASLGDTLALVRRLISVEGLTEAHLADVGRTEFDSLRLIETDERGRWLRHEVFAAERLEAAIARLYERHAERLPAGPERDRATGAASALGAMLSTPDDLERGSTVLAPDFESVDHRHLSGWSLRGANAFLAHLRALHEVADHIAIGVDEVLALEPSALLVRRLHSGTERLGGGAYERAFLVLFVADARGRIARAEWFDPDREAEALAHFDALAGGGESEPTPEPFANAASRADLELFDRFHARDWAGIEALAAPELVFDERRRMVRNTCGRDLWLEQFRILFDVPASRFATKLLATRGERLALNRHCFTGEVAGGGGPLAMEDHLALHEVDREGRIVGIVLFDLEDLDAAHAELDARFAAGEGAAHAGTLAAWRRWEHAIAIRDWDAMRAKRSPAFVFRDHRLLGWGTTMSDAASAAQITKVLVDLAPDVQRRHDHVRLCARGILEHLTLVGTRDGGAFENVFLAVYEWDAQGRCQAIDNYDVDRFELARARFAEIAAPARAEHPFANAATRYNERFVRAWDARDWNGVRALHRPECRVDDRRRLTRIEGPAEDGFRFFFDQPRSRWTVTPLATRGERLVLSRLLLECDVEEEGGAAAIDYLCVDEVDADGLSAAMVVFDPDDLDAAYAELDARYDVLEAALYPRAAAARVAQRLPWRDRDWVAFAAKHAPDLVCRDHRLLGWGTLHGIEAWMRTQQVLVELAPDTGVRTNHVVTSEHGYLRSTLILGTRDGGAFELAFLRVDEVDAAGKVCRIDLYDADSVDAALARFAELAAKTSHDPLAALAKPNLATRAWDRQGAWPASHDRESWIRQCCAPDMIYEDRQRFVQISGDRELYLASLRERDAAGARPSRRLVGTAGDRIAVMRILWSGGPPDGRFESVMLSVGEVDASGLFTAIVSFDPDEARAAQREAWARWAALEPDVAPTVALISEAADAFNAHDRARLRAIFADDVVVEDHRHASMGRIEGGDAYTDSIAVLWGLASAARTENGWFWPAIAPHGGLTTIRRTGDVAGGGGAFESDYLWLFLHAGGRIRHVELFELEDLTEALARFEALRASAPGSTYR